MTHDPTGPVRTPALDEEDDGLDCFATEAVSVIETADDAAANVVEPQTTPATIGAGAPEVWPRGLRELAFVSTVVVVVSILAAAVLQFQIVRPPARPMNEDTAVPVPAPRSPASSPAASGAPQPIVRPAIEPAPAADSRATTPNREVEVARPATPPLPSPAVREASAPARASLPDASVRPMLPSFAAIESPIVEAAAEARTESAPETPRALAPPAIIVPPSDQSSIERVLAAYQDAYERLDAPSAAMIWPRVDTRALSRAFSTLAQQDLSFDSCDLDIDGARAKARCIGEIRYVRRVGDQVLRVRRMSWSFALERVADRWQIAQVMAD